ncbi:TPA: hypothetical protein NJ746_004569 [Vibrio parahaemolyticus]|nr:hypothetical protein [Vibrio parahaemolyticus]
MDDNDIGLLLDFHGQTIVREDGYWYKFEAWKVRPSDQIPHGVRYNLTLHNEYGTRVLGFDNAHGVSPPKKSKYSGKRKEYDHKHRKAGDKGVPYEFESCAKLLEDFFNAIDETIAVIEKR